MNTKITERLKIEQPLLAFSHSEQVVAAVSRAGGMGVLGAGNCSVEDLDAKLTWLGGQLGDVPFGVDLLLPGTYEAKEHGGLERDELVAQVPEEHRRFVEDLLADRAVPKLAEGYRFGDVVDGGRMPIVGNHTYTARDSQPLIEACLASRATLFANALGVPGADVLDAFHAKGVPVAGLAGTARHGEKHRRAGTDIVIAQGYEAGGHTGDIGSMVLIPDMVDAVDGLPVLAAGGIASGRQMAAAMVLGASGVWTGSVWLTTEEAETGPGVREKFLRANASDTLRSRATTGKPARQLRSAWTNAWEAGEVQQLGMPHQGILSAEPQVRLFRASDEGHVGATDLVTYFVGQVVGRLKEVRPAADVYREIVNDCQQILGGANPLVGA
jgi:NAD(P)H-dependent flavin oxidoreductase YrpB (nitropropane dioxygenase family)